MSSKITDLEESKLKTIIKAVIKENSGMFKGLIKEVLLENKLTISEEKSNVKEEYINLSANLNTVLEEDKEVLQKLAK